MDQRKYFTTGDAVLRDEEKINCADEDKKFASRAVAYLIKHSREGFVPLCASVATLLQERYKLKQENKTLREHISNLKKCKSLNSCNVEPPSQLGKIDMLEHFDKKSECHSQKDNASGSSVSSEINFPMGKVQDILPQWLKTKASKNRYKCTQNKPEESKNDILQMGIFPIAECLCRQCLIALKLEQTSIFSPLKHNDRVIIKGELLGEVKYVGHLDDSPLSSVIYVGLQLDESVGDNDGSICGKRYFFCPENFGLLIPLTDVCCVIR